MTEHIRDRLYLDVEAERLRQEQLWGVQHHSAARWLAILSEERLEVSREANEVEFRDAGREELRKELIQEVAVCMAWLEDIDAYEAGVRVDEDGKKWSWSA